MLGTLIWLSQTKKLHKSIENCLLILLIPRIAKLGKTWGSYYEIIYILTNYYFWSAYLSANFFSDILIWRSPNFEKFTHEIAARRQIAIWGLRLQIAICWRAIFSCVIFSWFWPLKIKICGKKLYGHNPLWTLNHIGL